MRKTEMTQEQALNGMIQLFNLVNEPKKINVKELSSETGLPIGKISVLKQQGILVCRPVSSGKPGRAFEWVWEGHRPNVHMAKKLATSRPIYPSFENVSKKTTPTPSVEEKVERPNNAMHSKVTVHKTFEITKRLNGLRVDLLVVKNGDGNIILETEINPGTTGVDELRCYGYAFLTAADEISKE